MSSEHSGLLDPEFVQKCADEVRKKGKYEPKYLVVSHKMFDRITDALSPLSGHCDVHIVNAYKKAGIACIVWAHDIKDIGEFYLSSGKGISPKIETLVLEKKPDRGGWRA